jgi:hypothetical protein
MKSTYNIYKQLTGKALAWVDRVDGLSQAQERISRMKEANPGRYIIFDVRERTVVWSANA